MKLLSLLDSCIFRLAAFVSFVVAAGLSGFEFWSVGITTTLNSWGGVSTLRSGTTTNNRDGQHQEDQT